jgi:hypothetical protein
MIEKTSPSKRYIVHQHFGVIALVAAGLVATGAGILYFNSTDLVLKTQTGTIPSLGIFAAGVGLVVVGIIGGIGLLLAHHQCPLITDAEIEVLTYQKSRDKYSDLISEATVAEQESDNRRVIFVESLEGIANTAQARGEQIYDRGDDEQYQYMVFTNSDIFVFIPPQKRANFQHRQDEDSPTGALPPDERKQLEEPPKDGESEQVNGSETPDSPDMPNERDDSARVSATPDGGTQHPQGE